MVSGPLSIFGQDEPSSAFTQDPTTGCISINVDPTQYTPSVNPGGPGCANNPSWAGNQQPDVWVLINVPSTGVLFLNPSGTVDAGMAAYTFNAATNTYTLLDCDDDTGPGLMPQITVTQPAGTPIYVQLWAYGGGNISFQMCSAECASPQAYSPDADGDGYGEAGVTVTTCNPEPGWVTNTGDCNDQCGTVYTGMPCDDGNPETVGDVIVGSNCMCEGTIPTNNPCIPAGAESYTFTPNNALTAPVLGSNVQICYSIDWAQASGSWMDGIQFQLGPGFTNIVGVTAPANCNGGGGNWMYSTTINPTSNCALAITDDLSATNNTVGYYFDNGGTGNPGSNWGDAGSCVFTACISATVNSVNVSDLTVNTYASGDDYFGSYGLCGPCEPQAFPFPSSTTGPATCGINLPVCVTPSLCDENTGLITIDNTNQNFVAFFNPPASGNLIIEVNGQQVQSIPAPFVGSPADMDFTMYANGSATNVVTAYFDALPTCTATSNLASPAACGCLVEFQSVTATCQPMPVGGSGDNYYDVEVDLNVNALPIGSTLTMEYECGGTQPWLINNNLVMTTINDNTWSFGVFAPLNTQGALALSNDGLCDITFTIVDAGGNDLGGICTLPAPETVTIPQIELINPSVTNCTSTAQGSAFDVALTANIAGFDVMSANNILSFFNNGAPIAVSVNGNPAANTFDLTTLPAGTTTIDLDYTNVVYNDANALSFSISDGACNFNALVNETDPATAAVLSNAFNFTINNTAGNPFFSEPCTCEITNLQVTNATPDCIGYGNFFELEVSFDFAYPPNGVDAHVYFTSTLDTVANPVFIKNTLNQYQNFSNTYTTGNFPPLSYFAQIPTPPAGVGLTEAYTNNLVVDFEYPNGTGLTCTAVVPFTLPGACNCDIVDMGTFSPAVTPAGAATPNQMVLCPNETINFVSNNNFTPPAIAYAEIAPNDYQPIPDERALGLILIDPTTGQQILWDYQTIDFSGATPTISNPLSIDNSYNGAAYTTQDQIITLLNSTNDPMEMPLVLNARIVTIYNISNLLGAGAVPMLLPASQINPADPAVPYSGDIFATGVEPFLGSLVCGGFTTDWELVFTPVIEVENITPDCPTSSITFDVHSGSYAFDWNTPILNSAGGPVATMNNAANATVANITYSGLTTGYVLDITLEDEYGCTQDHIFSPFVAPTIGQISLNELGGNPVLLPSSPNQTIRCGSDPNFQLVGQWANTGNNNPQAGEWEIIWNGSTFTGQLNGYINPGPNNIGSANAIDFSQLYNDLLNDGLLNTNTTLFPANQPLYFSLRFNPTVAAPGCSEWSDEYQIAFLDNFIPNAVLAPAGTDAVSKCMNEAQFDLSAIGGLPLNGIWHIGPIDPITSTGAQDFIIENGSTFDLSNVANAGQYEAYYDVTGVAGVECPVLSNDFITITIHDTTDAVVTPDLFEDCMPQADFVLTNTSDLVNGTTDCEWYLDDILQTSGDCNGFNLSLMMPKTFDITLVITDINGCVDTTRYEDLLEVHPQPEVAFLYNPAKVSMDDPEFQFLDNSESPLVSYAWNFANYGSSSEPYTSFNFSEVTEPGSYDVVLTGTDANQCSTEVTRQVMIEEGFVVFMPSSFTPDDDNLNEALRPVISGSDRIRFYKFVVFDRWGNIVFETNDFKEWWIGDNQSMSGYYVPNGAYQWRMEVILEGLEDRKIYTGAVTIIR